MESPVSLAGLLPGLTCPRASNPEPRLFGGLGVAASCLGIILGNALPAGKVEPSEELRLSRACGRRVWGGFRAWGG